MADGDGKYFRLDPTKSELDIPTDGTDEVDNKRLQQYGREISSFIDNELTPYVITIPVTDTNITTDLELLCLYGVARRYKIFKTNFESAKAYGELFDDLLNNVINRFKANPTRSARTAVTKAYRTEPQASDF